MHKTLFIAMALAGASLARAAGELPPEAMVSDSAPLKTLAPKVVPNSGRLEWVPHDRDLSGWVTLSYKDLRSARTPQRARYQEPLNGDAARGREIAHSVDRGNCVVCHELPGDEWPGSMGNSLLHYKRFGYDNALIYQQIYDARVNNPYSNMPPYGTQGILSDQDIRDLVAYLQSLE